MWFIASITRQRRRTHLFVLLLLQRPDRPSLRLHCSSTALKRKLEQLDRCPLLRCPRARPLALRLTCRLAWAKDLLSRGSCCMASITRHRGWTVVSVKLLLWACGLRFAMPSAPAGIRSFRSARGPLTSLLMQRNSDFGFSELFLVIDDQVQQRAK